MPLFMRTRRIMKEKVLTTVVTFETTTQAIAMERECKKNKFTGRKRNLQIGRNRILNQNLGYKNQNMKTVQEEEHG